MLDYESSFQGLVYTAGCFSDKEDNKTKLSKDFAFGQTSEMKSTAYDYLGYARPYADEYSDRLPAVEPEQYRNEAEAYSERSWLRNEPYR